MKKNIIKLLSITFILLSISCNSDDDNNSVELTQDELLVESRWNFKEQGLIVNDELIPDGTFECADMNFMEFFADNTYYESDFFLNNNVCVDSNTDENGTWEIVSNTLKRIITFDGNNNQESLEENIRQLDLNNLILSASQTDEQGDPETYYIHYTR